jgi:hypothetical protein
MAEDNFTSLLEQADAEQTNQKQMKLRGSVAIAAEKDPDKFSNVVKLSNELKADSDFVEKNFDALSKQKKREELDYGALLESHPGTAEFLGKPENAALSLDDL